MLAEQGQLASLVEEHMVTKRRQGFSVGRLHKKIRKTVDKKKRIRHKRWMQRRLQFRFVWSSLSVRGRLDKMYLRLLVNSVETSAAVNLVNVQIEVPKSFTTPSA